MLVRPSSVTEYIGKARHWCPHSERFTGVDSLLSFLLGGWSLSKTALRHETRLSSSRILIVYYFELRRQDKVITMAVTYNPRIDEIIREFDLCVMTATKRQSEIETTEAPRVICQEIETQEVALVG